MAETWQLGVTVANLENFATMMCLDIPKQKKGVTANCIKLAYGKLTEVLIEEEDTIDNVPAQLQDKDKDEKDDDEEANDTIYHVKAKFQDEDEDEKYDDDDEVKTRKTRQTMMMN